MKLSLCKARWTLRIFLRESTETIIDWSRPLAEKILGFHYLFLKVTNNHFRTNLTRERAKKLFAKKVRMVEIEVFSYCNRRCWFCSNAVIDRTGRNIEMSQEVYEKILRNLKEIHYNRLISYSRYNEPLADKIISSLNEGIILDLGTGPGFLPIEITKRSPSIKVVGIDLSRKLIHMAQVNALKAGLSDRLDFAVGNAAKLRFEDEFFDMVISTGMFHSLRHPVKVLKEICRVLKKGGEAWIYDPARIASQMDVKKWNALLTFRDRFYLRFFTILGLLNPSIKSYNRSQFIKMIEKANGEMQIKLIR